MNTQNISAVSLQTLNTITYHPTQTLSDQSVDNPAIAAVISFYKMEYMKTLIETNKFKVNTNVLIDKLLKRNDL